MDNAQIFQDLTSAEVTDEPERVKSLLRIYNDPYEAAKETHAIVILTEWDEFKVSIIRLLYPSFRKKEGILQYGDTIKLYQSVGNRIRNIIVLKTFFKIFNSFWDIYHVLIFWLRKKIGAKFDFFSKNFNFVPSHNKVILNCG